MSVLVRDTLSGQKVEVGQDGKIGLYVCGPTVYNHPHIGNIRAPLFWDVVARYLKSRGYEVTFVQNITDIEDKIINRANEESVSWEEIVNRYTDSFHERLEMLGVGLPDIEPRATEHIPEMISLIEGLIEKGHAYAPGNGDVYYSVESFPQYGALSRQRPEEMRETEKGAAEYKRSPLDFALWKASKPGEPSWESPWGPGRPGWHIECSAMVLKHLPGGADIHGGGTDLRFPHHENELAQSAGARPDHTFVRAWAHHGMVNMAADKMAKSVGNIVDVKEAVERFGMNAIRMWFLQSHYSHPIDFSEEILEEKKRSNERLRNLYTQIGDSTHSSELSDNLAVKLRERFDAAMQDDFNTPEALAAVFDIAGRVGKEISTRPQAAKEFLSVKDALAGILFHREFGLGFTLPVEVSVTAIWNVLETVEASRTATWNIEEASFKIRVRGGLELGADVQEKVSRRERARREKNWALADRLRDELRDEGWTVEDTPEGPILSRR